MKKKEIEMVWQRLKKARKAYMKRNSLTEKDMRGYRK